MTQVTARRDTIPTTSSDIGNLARLRMVLLPSQPTGFCQLHRSNHAVWLRSKRFVLYAGASLNVCLVMVKRRHDPFGEVIFGKRRAQQFGTHERPTNIAKECDLRVMTHIENLNYDQVGNLYGLRNWVEYGLKQKQERVGWADFH